MTPRRQLILGAFLPAPGHHVAAWRHPRTRADGGLDLQYYASLARTAERGKFDLMFLSDGAGIRTYYKDADELSRQGRMVHFEPLTLLSALSTHTTHLGLCATCSTSYNEPFNVARKFASLDFLSQGRAAWNVVTSATDSEAQNYNLDTQHEHAVRYRRATEFMDVVAGLWDSWDDDAFLFDKESGCYFDPAKVHALEHQGEFFSVRGPLNLARPPQGRPVVVQAGSSTAGRAFAARFAEVIFTAQQTLDGSQRFYREIKSEVAETGRNPDHALVLPGFSPVIGSTVKEARQRYQELQELIDPTTGLGLLAGQLGDVDLSSVNLDGPLPDFPLTEGSTSRQLLLVEQARREGLTVRQLCQAIAGARGHHVVIGTPEMIADEMELWFSRGAADGFNIMPPHLPDGLSDFVDQVVPVLQRRGLFRTEYEGRTLREHLGLPRPASRWAAPA